MARLQAPADALWRNAGTDNDEAFVGRMLWGFDEAAERATFDEIQRRLIRLEAALFEEFGSRISSVSRTGLQRLFVAYPSVRSPIISARPDGTLTATWRNDAGEELAIRCAADGGVHYALATLANVGEGRMDRQWGTCHNVALFLRNNPSARRVAEG